MDNIFDKKANEVYNDALEDLKKFVSINTIYDEKTKFKDCPFGKGVRRGLDYVAELGKKFGYKVDRCDYYATELSIGEGEKVIDIYAHSDVVPVSKNWKTDPFYPTIENNIMYARGASDDKGPLIAALYGLNIVKDNFPIEGYKIRFIVGGDEERGSSCLEHYFNVLHKGYPTYGFSPDADYPLIYAEKGIFSYKASYNVDLKGIKEFSFGQALNVVLSEVELPLSEDFKKTILEYKNEHKEVKISYENGVLKIIGKPSHGSVPENGINAGLHLLNLLSCYYHNPLLNKIYEDYKIGDGKNFKGDYSSFHFKGSSYCVGKLSYKDGKLTIFVNMRLPENVDEKDAINNVKENTKANEVELLSASKGFIIDPNSDFILALLNAYQEETSDYTSKVEAIGGGTYSRESKNTVAFGMQFPGIDTLMHQDGEFLRLEDFKKSIAIYAHAIYNLGKLIK